MGAKSIYLREKFHLVLENMAIITFLKCIIVHIINLLFLFSEKCCDKIELKNIILNISKPTGTDPNNEQTGRTNL